MKSDFWIDAVVGITKPDQTPLRITLLGSGSVGLAVEANLWHSGVSALWIAAVS